MNDIISNYMTIEEATKWESEVSKSVNSLRLLLANGYERKVYQALGYETWTECLKSLSEKYGFSERRAWQLHAANQTEKLLNHGSVGTIPERQLRPLASVPADEQMQVWQQVIDTAPMGLVTAAHVQDVVEEYKGNGKPHVSNNSGENEWYTPPEYIAAARKVMGRIDLDPASSDKANEIVKASRYYTKQDDGLNKFWAGRVWINPPYASNLIGKFISKFTGHVKNGDISEGIVLVNNATETNWFSQLISVSCAVVFPTKRIKFIDTEGDASGTPLQGQAIVYIGSSPDKFIQEFGIFGWSAKTC